MDGFNISDLITLLFALALSLLFFLAIRELVLWYWKVNVALKQIKEQNEYLRTIAYSLGRIEKHLLNDNQDPSNDDSIVEKMKKLRGEQ